MTTEQEIEAITERLKFLKNQQYEEISKYLKIKKDCFMKRADILDPKFKELYHDINNLVEMAGWKDFYYGVFNYQKNCINSGYEFK